jgi:hypothetical protein
MRQLSKSRMGAKWRVAGGGYPRLVWLLLYLGKMLPRWSRLFSRR